MHKMRVIESNTSRLRKIGRSEAFQHPCVRRCKVGAEIKHSHENVLQETYLFCGSNAGGERAAIYALLGSAKLNGLDPEIYLHHVLERIADHPITQIAELLPWNVTINTPTITPQA
jgi:hypothetical protein